MTEAEWLKSIYPSDMLLWLDSSKPSERKVLLFLVAAWSHASEEYSQVTEEIIQGLDRLAEGTISREELGVIRGNEGRGYETPTCYAAAEARYWIATSKPARKRACQLIRDIFGNPFRPVALDPAWRRPTVSSIVAVRHRPLPRSSIASSRGTRSTRCSAGILPGRRLLKLLNGKYSPHDLYGRRPADEDYRGDE
jgi:hypothetical protein